MNSGLWDHGGKEGECWADDRKRPLGVGEIDPGDGNMQAGPQADNCTRVQAPLFEVNDPPLERLGDSLRAISHPHL